MCSADFYLRGGGLTCLVRVDFFFFGGGDILFGVDAVCDDGVGVDGGCDGVGVGMNRCVSVESGGSQRCQHQQSFGSLRNHVH